jgi:hypothetical protein
MEGLYRLGQLRVEAWLQGPGQLPERSVETHQGRFPPRQKQKGPLIFSGPLENNKFVFLFDSTRSARICPKLP